MTDTAEGEVDAPARAGTFGKAWKWLVGAIGAALAGLIATVVAGAWPHVDDVRRDITDSGPLRVVIHVTGWEGEEAALAEPLTKGPDRFLLLRGMTLEQWDDLLRRHKAARVAQMDLVIVVQGRRHETIRVIDVRPHILAAGPVLRGTCIHVPTNGGQETFEVKADLDHLRPGYGTKDKPATFLPKSVDLNEGERATVEMSVLAKKRSYEFDIEITYDYEDGVTLRKMYVRQPNGDPFRVTGEAKRYAVGYTDPSIGAAYREVGRNRSC